LEITLDKKSNTEGLIKIKLTEGDYQPNVEEKVKDYAKKANIKGFRPGKVPTGVIKRMFGKSILVDEINHLLSHKLSDYIRDNNIRILGDPLPNQEAAQTIDWDAQKDFEFEYQIGMVDDFKYEISDKIKVKAYKIEVEDKIVDETIADLKRRFGKVNYPESSGAGDSLTGDLRQNDGDFKSEYTILDTSLVDKKEQKKFIGLKKDDTVEFDIDKVFSDKAGKARLLGLSSETEAEAINGPFVFTVATVSRIEDAKAGQELFDRVFGKESVTNEEEFINKVRETVAENYKRESDHFLEHNIEDHLIKHTRINLPEDFLRSWLKNSGEGKVTDDVLDKEFDSYKRGLVWDLIRNKIAEDNTIKVETEEVRNKAKELIVAQFGGQAFAEQMKDRLEGIADNYLSNEDGQNFMRLFHQLRNQKIIDYIKENISISEKKVSVDEFKKIVATHEH
jgi:trigger factor